MRFSARLVPWSRPAVLRGGRKIPFGPYPHPRRRSFSRLAARRTPSSTGFARRRHPLGCSLCPKTRASPQPLTLVGGPSLSPGARLGLSSIGHTTWLSLHVVRASACVSAPISSPTSLPRYGCPQTNRCTGRILSLHTGHRLHDGRTSSLLTMAVWKEIAKWLVSLQVDFGCDRVGWPSILQRYFFNFAIRLRCDETRLVDVVELE